jgi:hypothetical protein
MINNKRAEFMFTKTKQYFREFFDAPLLSEDSYRLVKEVLKGNVGVDQIKSDNKLKNLFKENFPKFEDYWGKKFKYIKRWKDKIFDYLSNTKNTKNLDKAIYFLECENKHSEVNVFLCMGKLEKGNFGLCLNKNIIFMPGEFEKEGDYENSFGIILHEILHLFQNDFKTKYIKEIVKHNIDFDYFFESLIRVFAPKGILLGKQKIWYRFQTERKIIEFIEEAFKKGLSFSKIKDSIINLFKEENLFDTRKLIKNASNNS